jgi:hypothetical protein
MAEKQDKYIVLKREDIDACAEGDIKFAEALCLVMSTVLHRRVETGRPLSNEYLVCNMDEPYAEKVLQIILEGEDAKIATHGGEA